MTVNPPNSTPHPDARERRAVPASVGARRWARTLDGRAAMVRRALYAVAVIVLAGRLIAGELQVPSAAQIANCSVDPVAKTSNGAFSKLSVTCADVSEFLSKAHAVSEWQWLHEYSHVALGDRSGRLTLHDGTALRWMIRPGGLAYLEFADGRKVYLVSCCLKRPSNNALEQSRGQ
jgi:hypothetical protein